MEVDDVGFADLQPFWTDDLPVAPLESTDSYLMALSGTVKSLDSREAALGLIGQTLAAGEDIMPMSLDVDMVLDDTDAGAVGAPVESVPMSASFDMAAMTTSAPAAAAAAEPQRKRRSGSIHARHRSDPEALRYMDFHTLLAAPAPELPPPVADAPPQRLSVTMQPLLSAAQPAPLPPTAPRAKPATRRQDGASGKQARVRNYMCGKCKQPKKGHVCPHAVAPPPKMCTMGTQVDLAVTASDITPAERRRIARALRADTAE